MSLEGRIVIVTGSGGGLGRAHAVYLASKGAKVVVNDVSQAAADGVAAEIAAAGGEAMAVACSVTDEAGVAAMVERTLSAWGRIDILVNNAGFADYSVVADMSMQTFDRTVEHYLRTPFVLTQAAIPHMRAQGQGWIVNIGSVTGLAPARPYREYNKSSGDVIYASCKAALHRFTQGVAAELLDADIAVNAVGPSSAVRTPGASALIPDTFPTEPVEYLAETVLAMCHRPAAERTGLVAFSLHYPWSQKLPVHSLDGTTVLPPLEPPAAANPNILPAGM